MNFIFDTSICVCSLFPINRDWERYFFYRLMLLLLKSVLGEKEIQQMWYALWNIGTTTFLKWVQISNCFVFFWKPNSHFINETLAFCVLFSWKNCKYKSGQMEILIAVNRADQQTCRLWDNFTGDGPHRNIGCAFVTQQLNFFRFWFLIVIIVWYPFLTTTYQPLSFLFWIFFISSIIMELWGFLIFQAKIRKNCNIMQEIHLGR